MRKRLGLLLILLLIGHARADPSSGFAGLDLNRLSAVYTEALGFVAPRILDPVPISQLTVWGLRGLTSIDPALRIEREDARVRLIRQGHMVAERLVPTAELPAPWARLAVEVTAAGYEVSLPLRRAGTQGLIESFFDEMFSHIDIYSRYVPPVEAGADRASRAGRAGLGIEVAARGAQTAVRAVVRDSPAAIAGIRPGDVLVAVDGQRTADQDIHTIRSLLSGDEGSSVTLTVRGRDGRLRDMPMVRAMVPPETVFARRIDDVLVLRITSFSNSTASHIAQSVQDAMAEPDPASGIILDLRDNRGGLLRQAMTAADTFLPEGPMLVTKGRDPDSNHIWRSADGELAENVPLVVMVDGYTASAAEILAAVLADRGRAVVVGSSTVGKGLVQTIDPMPDGGELFVTWSRVLAPRGWPLQGLGVMPQVCTSLGEDALNRQLAALSKGFQPMDDAVRMERAARVPVSASEELELRAPCPAAHARGADLNAALFLAANPAAYAAALLPPMDAP